MRRTVYGKLWTGVAMTALLMMFAGCGSSDYKMTEAVSSAVMQDASTNAAGALEYGYGMPEAADAEMDSYESTAAEIQVSERKLIKTVDMEVETQSYDELLATIQSKTSELGGYIESMNTYNGSSYYEYNPIRNADLTIRIPKEGLDGFLNAVSDISNVVRRSDNVEDVTLAYVDLESHRDALRTEQERLLQLLEQAETVEDIITIEQRLSDVRYQLESMESQLRTYDNQVDYSTVYLNVEEVEIFTPVAKETAWERISNGFKESLDNVGNGFVEFGIWFVVHIPYLVVWAVIIGAFVCLLLWLLKLSTRPSKKSVNKTFGQSTPMAKTEADKGNADK